MGSQDRKQGGATPPASVPSPGVPPDPAAARAEQQALRSRVERHDRFGAIRRVAGLDVGFDTPRGRSARGWAYGAVVVLDALTLAPLEEASARVPVSFPYVPGLLSFRETPALLAALAGLEHPPDLLLCDGQGYAHPRRFGIACHLGVLLDIPSIGVAKSRLIGRHEEPGPERGARAALRDGTEVIGTVLRTRTGVAPIYVSVGHRVSLETAVALVLACTPRYRLPETTRWAHRLASARRDAARAGH